MGKIAINIATGSLQKDEIIVGIDLGTTNSLIAVIHPDTKQPIVLKEHDSTALVPSIIYIDEQNNAVVGEPAKPYLISAPQSTIFSIKRLIGKTYLDVKNSKLPFDYAFATDNENAPVQIKIGQNLYSAVQLSGLLLKELKQRGEHILKTTINKAVITVPAYFNDAQRQATRDAGSLAGLEVLRIINEPTAASLAYGIGATPDKDAQDVPKIIAVFDLGGGTFDISLLRLSGGVFEVLATNGNTALGGDDFDHAIVQHWKNTLQLGNPYLHEAALRLKAEEAKKALSTSDTYEGTLQAVTLKLTLPQLASLITPLIQQAIACCQLAMLDAGLTKADVNEVIMVGGSTRVALVKKMVAQYFEQPINDTINPDEVVALGAAIQADILAGNNKNILLLDVTPLSLGIETEGLLMDVLIPRNSKIPSTAAREYTTQLNGQVNMRISVYQGERDIVTDNRLLATINLKGIPAMPAGMAKVKITFILNADGILTVKATELRSGIAQVVEIKPQVGIDDETVEKMLLSAMQNAEADIAARALAEANTEGEQLLKTTEHFIQKNMQQLTPLEMQTTAAAMQALQLALTLKDKNLIQQKTAELNNTSAPYAERIMNAAVGQAMKGRAI